METSLQPDPPAAPLRRRWPRVTLWQLFVAITTVTLIGSHVLTVQRLQEATAQIEKLHEQYGTVRVVDPEVAKAIVLTDSRQKESRAHIYQPENRRFQLCWSTHDPRKHHNPKPNTTGWVILERIIPEAEGSFPTPDVRELRLFIKWRTAKVGSELECRMEWDGGTTTTIIPIEEGHMVDRALRNQHPRSSEIGYGRSDERIYFGETRVHRDMPLNLFNIQRWSHGSPEDVEAGVVLWLDELPIGIRESP